MVPQITISAVSVLHICVLMVYCVTSEASAADKVSVVAIEPTLGGNSRNSNFARQHRASRVPFENPCWKESTVQMGNNTCCSFVDSDPDKPDTCYRDYGLGIWGTVNYPSLVRGVLVECNHEKDGCVEIVPDSEYKKRGFKVKAWMGGGFTITYDNGTLVEEYSNGTSQIIEPTTGIQVERHLDGSFVRFDPDGRIVKGYTDGTEVIIEPDSTLIRRNADGSVSSVTLSNGTEVEWPPVEMNITTTNHRENPHSQVNENLTVSLDQNQTPVQSQQGQLQQQQLLQQQWSPPDIEATTPSGKIDDPIFTDLIASSVFNSQGCTLFFPDKAGLARMQKNNEVWKKLTSSPKFRRCFYMQHLVPNVRLDLINATGIEKRDIYSASRMRIQISKESGPKPGMKIKTFNGFVKIKSLDDPRVSAHLFVNSSPENTCVTHVVEKPLLLVNPDKMDLDTCLQAPGTGLTNQTKQKNNLQTTTEISKGTPVAMEGPPVNVSV